MVAGSIPAAGARLDEHQRKLVFFLYPRALSAIRTFAITWLDTSETVFIGTSEFSKEILNFLSISERFEPRVARISRFTIWLTIIYNHLTINIVGYRL